MARPGLLTDQRQALICKALKEGASYRLAASVGGISYECLNKWRKAGIAELERREKEDVDDDPTARARQMYVDFYLATEQAEAERAMLALKRIKRAGAKNWTAEAWYLERRYPQEFGRQIQEVQGPDGGPIQVKQVVVKLNRQEDSPVQR
ncbi:hypothetical protein GC175_17105 [bacterium]|nr:hypothetical protein [bacterium]